MKLIIFDWGRTLHDPDTDGLFPGALEIVRELSGAYTLALVSLAKSQDPLARRRTIAESGLAPYFKIILVGDEGKDDMYEEALAACAASPARKGTVTISHYKHDN